MPTSQVPSKQVDEDIDKPPSLEEILQHLGLDNFFLTFQMEQIDGEALVCFTVVDDVVCRSGDY